MFLSKLLPCALGVLLSVILPTLTKSIRAQYSQAPGGPNLMHKKGLTSHVVEFLIGSLRGLWVAVHPHLKLLLFSLAVSLLIVALLGDSIATWRAALIAGYAWDSTLQKLTGKP